MALNAVRRPTIGLALGSGSARGWAHIGVLRALQSAGIQPDVICGASVGAIVAAAYASNSLDRFEQWVTSLRMRDVMSFMDIRFSGGMFKGEKLVAFFREHFDDSAIEDLPLPFAAVATALHTGNEVWLREGSLVDAVRASFALPGLFTPVRHQQQWLVDGGLVNPVPVSLARAMGADVVIAVDLNNDIMDRHLRAPDPVPSPRWMQSLQENLSQWLPESLLGDDAAEPALPSMTNVMAASINIMQVRITRSRMAGDPPDVVIAPRLAYMGLLDFHRASEAMEVGYQATELMLPLLRQRGLGHADAAPAPATD